MVRASFHPLKIERVDRLCEDAAAVTFGVPADLADLYAFRPGQSVVVRREANGVEQRRNYSICSAPTTHPDGSTIIRIGIRIVPAGAVSTWLVRDARPGDVVEVQTPTGAFALPHDVGGHHLLIGAGSGITPLLSIASSLLARADATVRLLYGNRRTATVMFAEELADLKDLHGPRFELVHVLSREPREVELFSGRLDADRVRQILGALAPAEELSAIDGVWLCGPFGMISELRPMLIDLGVPRDRVHAELFYVDDVPPPPVRHPEASYDGPVTRTRVVLDGRTTEMVLPRDQPVLDSAQLVRGDLPFACKGGVCGTCRAKIVHGEVDLRRNYALEPEELADGYVLTCQSYPISELLTVDYDS